MPVIAPLLLALAAPAAAAPVAPDPAEARDHHDGEAGEIIVTGVRKRIDDAAGGVSILSGDELAAALRPTIGETLARQPGVSATSFGPNASRPILRGLSGDRIRLLIDGIGSLDVSTASADHAVSINPLTAERIEVLRGPAALLFGSSAIGGVVNVIDSRIPRTRPERGLHADALLTLGSAADQRSANMVVDVPLAGHLVVHGDASWTRTGDLAVGGHVLARPLREAALASGDAEIAALAGLEGRLDNSDGKASDAAAALAYIDGRFNLGLAVSRHDNRYGVPPRHSLAPGEPAEHVKLDIDQWRFDARGEIPLGGPVDLLRIRGGLVDYRHDEIEQDGHVAGSFFSDGAERRIEAQQRERGGWGGAFGLHYLTKKVRIVGEEKYLPVNHNRQFGLFALEHWDKGGWRAEAGGRIEWSRLAAAADSDLATSAVRRRFTSLSGSLALSRAIAAGWRAGLALSRSTRAPSADELFANGPHAGTQAFEIGDPGFGTERSRSIEATLRGAGGPLTLAASLYHSRVTGYIYLAPTGAERDGLPVYSYRQGAARYRGFELEVDARLGEAAGARWSIEAIADAVRADIAGFGPAPQIPPLRLMGALAGERGRLGGRIEVERSFAQRRTAPGERATPGFTLVNIGLDWRPLASSHRLALGLAGHNLFDVVARRHSSLLKDHAPLAGRDLRLTARLGL